MATKAAKLAKPYERESILDYIDTGGPLCLCGGGGESNLLIGATSLTVERKCHGVTLSHCIRRNREKNQLIKFSIFERFFLRRVSGGNIGRSEGQNREEEAPSRSFETPGRPRYLAIIWVRTFSRSFLVARMPSISLSLFPSYSIPTQPL
jgi:hypothetical protein